MGTVYRRGRFWWVGFAGPSGAWIYRSSESEVKVVAEKLLAELEDRVRAGAAIVTPLTLAEFGRRWAKARVGRDVWTNAKLDQQALENHLYGAELDVHGRQLVFGKLQLSEVRESHVRAWLEYLEAKGLAGRTRSSMYSLLNRIMKRGVREELVPRNPCVLERGELPQQIDKNLAWRATAVFTAPEVEALLSDSRVPLDRRVLYALSFLGGLREGEISALKWSSYEPNRRPLGALLVSASYTRKNKREKSPKNKLPREVPVHPVAAALLAKWHDAGWRALLGRHPRPDDLLLPNRAGRHLTDLNVVENFYFDLNTLGLRRRRFHDSRRTFVTLARANGASPLLRWVSHGPKKSEMQDTYTSPPWAVLCREVRFVKIRLRKGKLVQLPTTFSTTHGGYRVKATDVPQETACPGRDSKSPGYAPVGGAQHEDSRTSLKATGTDARRSTTDRSNSTTARRLIPFRGGMRIDEG